MSAVSAGLTRDHPDPEGFHLAIVAAVAKLYLDGSASDPGAEGSPLAAAFKKAGLGEGAADFAFFWDFPWHVTHQHPWHSEVLTQE